MSAQIINFLGCVDVYESMLPTCPKFYTIKVYALLEKNTSFIWVITDKFANQYVQEFQTDGDGNFEIDVDSLPKQLFTQYSGAFMLTVKKDKNACSPTKFNFCDLDPTAEVYHVQFSFYKSDSELEAIIGCICE